MFGAAYYPIAAGIDKEFTAFAATGAAIIIDIAKITLLIPASNAVAAAIKIALAIIGATVAIIFIAIIAAFAGADNTVTAKGCIKIAITVTAVARVAIAVIAGFAGAGADNAVAANIVM